MMQQGLRSVCRRRRIGIGKRQATGKVVLVLDKIHRAFRAERPNQFWVADATQITTAKGTVYLATIPDVFSWRVLGWFMSATQDGELMVRALQMTVRTPHPAQFIHHSDHGSPHTSQKFRRAWPRQQ